MPCTHAVHTPCTCHAHMPCTRRAHAMHVAHAAVHMQRTCRAPCTPPLAGSAVSCAGTAGRPPCRPPCMRSTPPSSCTRAHSACGRQTDSRRPVCAAWSKCLLGRAPARLLRLLRACLAALDSSALPGREAGPLGAQPLPRILERAASRAADLTAVDPSPGMRARRFQGLLAAACLAATWHGSKRQQVKD